MNFLFLNKVSNFETSIILPKIGISIYILLYLNELDLTGFTSTSNYVFYIIFMKLRKPSWSFGYQEL